MSSIAYKNIGGYVCTEFAYATGPLRVCVTDAPPDARISLNGIFSNLKNGRGVIDISRLPDGKYPLFLHTSALTATLGTLEMKNGVISRAASDAEIANLERGYVKLYESVSEAQTRILALEKRVYESTLF